MNAIARVLAAFDIYPYMPIPVNSGVYVDVITPRHFDRLPDGTHLVSINGGLCVKGKDFFSPHALGGYLAYGFRNKGHRRRYWERYRTS